MIVRTIAVVLVACGLLTSCATGRQDRAAVDIVRAKFDAVNRHDLRAIIEAYGPGARLMASDFCAPRIGRDEVERTYRALFGSIEELRVQVDDIIGDGSHVAVRIRVSGESAGRRFEVPIANFFKVRNGLIEYDLGVFDNGDRPCRQ